MNGFSKTGVLCDCGAISEALNDPYSGIILDEQNMFVLVDSGGCHRMIYHCFFCGGVLPSSDKPIWYPKLTPEEQARLENLIEGIVTVEQAIERLGPPDYDGWMESFQEIRGEMVRLDHLSNQCRNVEYYKLSDVANVEFYFYANNIAKHSIELKRVSPRHVEE